jgi:hypothetical protein
MASCKHHETLILLRAARFSQGGNHAAGGGLQAELQGPGVGLIPCRKREE